MYNFFKVIKVVEEEHVENSVGLSCNTFQFSKKGKERDAWMKYTHIKSFRVYVLLKKGTVGQKFILKRRQEMHFLPE